jgi:hypothetical protein
MRNKLSWLLLLAAPLFGSCIYTDIKVPLDQDFNASRLGDKTGESSLQSVLWLVMWGDAGTQAAAQQGGLKVIHHADLHIMSVLYGLYSKQTTILYGE